MLTAKNVWTFGLIVVTFVFLPPENWDYWFLGSKAERFAQLCLRTDKHCYVIAKNLLPGAVHLGFKGVKSGLIRRIGASELEEMVAVGDVPPNSYSILELVPDPQGVLVRHSTEAQESFSPGPLTLIAPVEEDRWFFLVLALVLVSAGLTYSIGSFAREDDRQRAKTKTDYSWSSPP